MARRMELDVFIASYTGVNCKWMADLKANNQDSKTLRRKHGSISMNLGKDTLALAPVATGT